MDFLNSIPEWLGQASAAALVVVVVIIFYLMTRQALLSVLPFLKDLNTERAKMQAEQRDFYENKVIPTFESLADSLKHTLETQRVQYEKASEVQRLQYEAKLAKLESERNMERDKLVARIEELNQLVISLTDRITILENDNKAKDKELAELRQRLSDVEKERDELRAKLATLDSVIPHDLSQPTPAPDGDGQGHQKENAP